MQINNPVVIPQEIITSIQEPTNKNNIIWNELANNEIKNTWQWVNSRWISLQRHNFVWTQSGSLGGNVGFILPCNREFNYLFKKFNFGLYPVTGTTNSTNYWRTALELITTATSSIFSQNVTVATNLLSVDVNTLVTTPTNDVAERFNLSLTKVGSPPNLRPGLEVQYHLVRK